MVDIGSDGLQFMLMRYGKHSGHRLFNQYTAIVVLKTPRQIQQYHELVQDWSDVHAAQKASAYRDIGTRMCRLLLILLVQDHQKQ